MKKSTI